MKDRAVAAGELEAKCQKLLDDVASTGEPLTISQRDRPVAQRVSIPGQRSLFGAMRGSVPMQQDIVAPVGDPWEDAARPACCWTRTR